MDPQYQRIKLSIAYDGSSFKGWQSQASGNAIQDHLQRALGQLNCNPTTDKKMVLHGAGRTDAGVHAFDQAAHFDMELSRWEQFGSFQLMKAINAHLPETIRVQNVQAVGDAFHARFSAIGKIYRYRLWASSFQHPLEIEQVWHLAKKVDPDVLKSALNSFVGKHDFAAFAASRGKGAPPPTTTIREIFSIELTRAKQPTQNGVLYEIDFIGEGFLYKMVRLLVGASVRCAQGRAPVSWIEGLLDQKQDDDSPNSTIQKKRIRRTRRRAVFDEGDLS